MAGPFTLPPAMLAAAVAQNSGIGTGQVEAYRDRVEQDAGLKRILEQQRQFDAEQARLQQQFAATNELDKSSNARAERADTRAERADTRLQTVADRESDLWRKPSKADPFGGFYYQLGQQDLKRGALANRAGELTNQGDVLRNRGTALSNAAKEFQNAIAPAMNQLDSALLGNQIKAADPSTQLQNEKTLATFRDDLARRTYAWKAQTDQKYANDPGTLDKDIIDVSKALDSAGRGLQTTNPRTLASPLQARVGQPDEKGQQATLGDVLGDAASAINAAQDPLRRFSEIMSGADPLAQALRSNPAAYGYLAELAMQRNLLLRKFGSQSRGAGPFARPPAPPAPPSGINGLPLQPPRPFGPFGGSRATGPFSPP